MPIVPICQAEIMIASALGAMRQKIAIESGYYRQMGATPEEDVITERNGIIGEIAFGKWANVFVDFSYEARKGGCDFRIGGRRIDVKTSRREARGLTIDAWKIEHHGYADVDSFALVEFLSGPEYDVSDGDGGTKKIAAPRGGMLTNIVGYIDVAGFMAIARKITFDGGKAAYAVDRADLFPISLL